MGWRALRVAGCEGIRRTFVQIRCNVVPRTALNGNERDGSSFGSRGPGSHRGVALAACASSEWRFMFETVGLGT